MSQFTAKVLVCDDSLLIRKQLTDFLAQFGTYELFQATRGDEAIKVFEETRPDIVFLDIVMPELDGLECLKLMKKIHPGVKVVMLSSLGTKENLRTALDLGAVDFIQKPWKKDQLTQILARLKG
ncbi:MAG: response regulator [Firmicutes bacterium]|nr:response regulator [Bacillota bacterium]